jgi:ubiquinone/menaquinone biosynthesis C-methylase UbiE
MSQIFIEARRLRQRMFAWCLARFGKKLEDFLGQYKARLFRDLEGDVLEIGPGAGANLRYFSKDQMQWIGIEPNPFMHQYLLKEAESIGMKIELRTGTAEDIPAEEGSADAVISTLVLCSVKDQQRSLEEVFRVLKPGGKFLFIEHVAAPRGTWLRRIQHWLSPVWRQVADGCHPDRESWLAIENAGFEKVTIEQFKTPLPIVSPHIAGVAVKTICGRPLP